MEYLVHYGVKGMKWGVRRYQNKDGTLTPAGRKRYRASESKRSFSENVNEFGRGFAKASLKASYGRIMGEGLVKDISKMQTAKGKAVVGLLGGYARGNLINIYIRILLIRCLIASVVDCSFHFR